MNRTTATLAVMFLCLSTTVSHAQNAVPSAYEHLKGLEWLIGDQVGEYNVQEGWAEFAPVGTKITRQVSVRWALNKSIIVAQITTTLEGLRARRIDGDRLLGFQGKANRPLNLLAGWERFRRVVQGR